MKGKKFLNTKNVIIGLISFLLIGASVTGVTIFLKDRGEAEAAQQQGLVENLPITGSDEENNNQVGENVVEPGENTVEPVNPTTPNEEDDNTGDTTGGTGTTRPSTEEIVAGITETTVLEERKVFEDLELSWTTIALSSISTDMGIYKPELQIEKTATEIVRKENLEEKIKVDPENKQRVRAGDTVIFTIKVSNVGNYKATNVVVTDSLDVIFDGKKVEAGNPLVTLETLDYGKVAILKVAYEVTQDDIDATEIIDDVKVSKNIKNVAFATDGKTTVEDEDDMPVNPPVEISGSKTWDDVENQDGKRPESITIRLLANGEEIDTATVTAENNWSWSFANNLKYDDENKIITYTITEDVVADYKTEIDGFNVTNIHEPEVIPVTVTKNWDDKDDQDGIRPDSIEIQLYKTVDGIKTSMGENYKISLTSGEDEIWQDEEKTYTWSELPKYEGGNEITYTVVEVQVPEKYKVSYSDDTLTITNSYTPQTKKISGSKTWNDNDDQDGIRPDSITINLWANGETKVAWQNVTMKDNWSWKFENLPVYDSGDLIKYTITEDAVDGYKSEVEGYDVTNTHTPETIKVSGTKIWDDDEAPKEKRPSSITVNLLKNGKEIDDVEVKPDEDGNWAYEFKDLPKYEAGELITYTVTEDPVTDYNPTYTMETGNNGDVTINIKNTFNQDITGEIISIKETPVPLDVVFVLDISSSMLEKDGDNVTRAQDMVEATNEAIKELMKNPNNRVSVVLFNSDVYQITDTGVLKHYSANSAGNYITYQTVNEKYVGGRITFSNGKTVDVSTSAYPTGSYKCGTYTQGGIKVATQILKNSNNGTTITYSNGDTVTRKPVMILLTDGDPTHYDTNTNYNAYGTKYPVVGEGIAKLRYITAEYYAYTMKTMEKCKAEVTSMYNNKECEIYTVGINMEGSMAKTLLEPSTENISGLINTNNISNEIHNHGDNGEKTQYSVVDGNNVWRKGAEYYKYQSNRLNTLLTSGNNKITSNYVKKAYTESTSGDISENFDDIVNRITEKITINITAELYGSDRKIRLESFKPENAYTLEITKDGEEIDTTTGNYIQGDTVNGYYLVLTELTGKVTVQMTYYR